MSLHLIAVLVHTAKEVRAAMHIQHYAVSLGDVELFPRIIVLAHFNPFSLQRCAISSPLPPCLPANRFDAFWPKLCADELSRTLQLTGCDLDDLHVDPVRHWHPLRREGL
jgi:hypothetical protein|tara:strand:+ start:2770 stop:3099 length:330 start_codon:yes stop_codon:yes gene_type:complete